MPAPLVPTRTYDVDVVAAELARIAQMAVQMPPSWDGAKVTHGLTGTNGENLGRVLPGRGIALASDLKSLGITKPIPHVYDKTLAAKCLDAFGGTRERMAMQVAAAIIASKLGALGQHEALQMMPLVAGAITTYDGIINGRGNGKADDVVMYKLAQTTVAASWHSINGATLGTPTSGWISFAAIPGGTVCNRATSGSLSSALTNPSGTDKKYLITVGFTSSATLNMLLLIDVLVGASGISTNTATAQTVNTSAVTRYSGTAAAGNLMISVVDVALGATASSMNYNYTNSSGTTGRTTSNSALTTSAIQGRLQPSGPGVPWHPMQSGDIGVRSIETCNNGTAMGAGSLIAVIYRPLHFLPGVGANVYVERDSTVQIDGLTELVVGTDSELGSLAFFALPPSTSSGNFSAFLRTVAG